MVVVVVGGGGGGVLTLKLGKGVPLEFVKEDPWLYQVFNILLLAKMGKFATHQYQERWTSAKMGDLQLIDTKIARRK